MRPPTLAGLALVTFAALAGWTYPPSFKETTPKARVPRQEAAVSAGSSLPGVVPPACALARVEIHAGLHYRRTDVWWVWAEPFDSRGRLIAQSECPLPEPVWTLEPEDCGLALEEMFPWTGDLSKLHAGVCSLRVRVGAVVAQRELRVAGAR